MPCVDERRAVCPLVRGRLALLLLSPVCRRAGDHPKGGAAFSFFPPVGLNYYRHYIGDYQRDTGHLSLVEHGAYRVLMDAYYGRGLPLPADDAALFRIARAMTDAERDAVRSVADQFFPVATDGLRHSARADAEIPLALTLIENARSNGEKGGRPKTQRDTQRVRETKPSGFTNQPPTTNHQPPLPTTTIVERIVDNSNASPYRPPDVSPRLVLTMAANAGITARYGEQMRPIDANSGHTADAVDAIMAAGVPLDFAVEAIREAVAGLNGLGPPKTLKYFVPVVVGRWEAKNAPSDLDRQFAILQQYAKDNP